MNKMLVVKFIDSILYFYLLRSSFRDVLRGVEEGEGPNENIKFGKETLKIDSWFTKTQYDWFCKVNKFFI